MPIHVTSANRYLQVGVNHGNIYPCTEPRSVIRPQDTIVSNSVKSIDAATAIALDHALNKAQGCLVMVQDAASQSTQIIEVAERLRNQLQNLEDLNAKQWHSLDSGVIPNVFSLLYCCIMECDGLKPTPLAISSLCDGLVASNLAIHCVHGAALMYVLISPFPAFIILTKWLPGSQNDKRWVSSQQQRVTDAIKEMGDKRFKNANGMSQAIYHSQAVLNLFKDTCEPAAAAGFGDMHVSFGGGNRGIQAAEYRGSMHLTFPL